MPVLPVRPAVARTRRTAAVLAVLLAFGAPAAGGAQGSGGPRQIDDNATAWFMYFGDHAVSRRWALHAEAQVRRADGALGTEEWQQLLLRPGLIYTIAPNVRVSAGWAHVTTWPYGDQPVRARFPEQRTWQQLQLTQGTGRVAWLHRYRLEQRWQDVPVATPDGGTETDRRYTNRMRYLVRATVPLQGRTLDRGEAYATVYDEAMINWGRNVGRNVFDQNRAYAALGWRATATSRVEVGYLQQLVAKPDGIRLERNHSLQIALFQTAALRRPR